MPDRLYSPTEFAAAIRTMYPALAGVTDDNELTHAVVETHPVFRPHVNDLLAGSELAPPINRGGATLPPPPAPDTTVPQRRSSARGGFESGMGLIEDLALTPLTGSQRVIKGGERLPMPGVKTEPGRTRGRQLAGGLADIVGGGMEAGTLAVPGALVRAPLQTAAGLLVGSLAAEGTHAAGEALGAPPEVSDLFSEIGALVGGVAAAHGAGAPARGRARVTADARRQIGLEDVSARADVAREQGLSEDLMHRELADETANLDREAFWQNQDDLALHQGIELQTRRIQSQQLERLHALIAENRRLDQLAKEHRAVSPFDYMDKVRAGTVPSQRELPPAPPVIAQTEGAPPIDPILAELIDSFSRVPPVGPTPPPPLPLELGPAQGLPTPRTTFIGADPNAPPLDPNRFDVTDPTRSIPIVQAEGAPPDLINQLGEQLSSQLEFQPPGQARPTPEMRTKYRERDRYRQAYQTVVEDIASQMEEHTYQSEKLVTTPDGLSSYYTPRSGGAPIYHVLAETAERTPKTRYYVAQMARAFADSGGVVDGAKLPPATRGTGDPTVLDRLMSTLGFKTEAGARRSYTEWAKAIHKVADQEAVRRVIREDRWEQEGRAAREAADAEAAPPDETVPPPESEGPPPSPESGLGQVDVSSGTPAAGGSEAEGGPPMPDFLRDLEADPTAVGGYEEGELGAEPTLPGIEPVEPGQAGAPPPPVADLPQPRFDLSGEAGAEPTQPSMFDRLKGERGVLILDVPPGSTPAKLQAWLDKHEAEHGESGWWKEANDALAAGDTKQAWRIAAMSSSKSLAGALGTEAKDKEAANAAHAADLVRAGPAFMDPDVIEAARQAGMRGDRPTNPSLDTKARAEQQVAAHRRAVEKELGYPLPNTVDVSPDGILTFDFGGKGIPAVKARATDLTLARSQLHDLTERMDPGHIVYVEGNTDPNRRVNAQIADSIIRDYSDDDLADILDLTGIKDEVELGRQYRRAFSQAGRVLGQLGRWTQENKEWFYLLQPGESGAAGEAGSVGAKQAAPILNPDGFVQWLGSSATPAHLDAIEFHLPKGMNLKDAKGELTPEAKRYARGWARRQQRVAEVGKTLDLLAEDGSDLDRAVLAATISPQLTPGKRGPVARGLSLSKAFLVSLPATAIRNTWSQAGRYGFGLLDDTLAGAFALAGGDSKKAGMYFTEAGQLAKSAAAPGSGSSVAAYKHPTQDSIQVVYDYTAAKLADLPKNDVRHALNLIDQAGQWGSTFLGSMGMADEATGGAKWDDRLRNLITVNNRVQESAFRATVADGVMRAQLVERGIDPNLLADGPQAVIDKLGAEDTDRLIGASVAAALDYTFAAQPLPGTVPSVILKAFNSVPILSTGLQLTVQAFPRFNFVSAPRWINDHLSAPLFDSLAWVPNQFRSDTSPAFRGRYFQMMQRAEQGRVLATMDGEIGRQEYDAAKALGTFKQERVAARPAAKAWKQLEARAAREGMLPEIQQEMAQVSAELHDRMDKAETARRTWRDAETRIRNLREQRDKSRKTYSGLEQVGAARGPEEYWARVVTGSTLLAAAYFIRRQAMEDGKADKHASADTKWYEYPMGEGQVADLRGYSPLVQYLLPADFMLELENNTDWDKLPEEAAKVTATDWNFWSSFLQKHYHGKYTSAEAQKELASAFLSISPAAGSTRDILDMVTGRTSEGNTPSPQDMVLGVVGEFVGRFGTPFEVVNQTLGQFRKESAKARIPVTATKESSRPLGELADPFLKHVPGVREAVIPEKVSPLTGEAIQTLDPIMRAWAGVTKRTQNRVESEITATGLPYAKAVPRVTGDREFDNKIAVAYAKLLQEHFSAVLDHEAYGPLTPELKRDVLEQVFMGLKKAAYGQVADELGAETVAGKLTSPATRQKHDRWQQYLDQLQSETPEPPSEPDEEPSAGATPPPRQPGAPPPSPI